MPVPFHQFVEYSNPATPRVYAWEVASTSATSTSDQDAPLQPPSEQHFQQQDVQQFIQQQQQHISPSQLQLHQLPPTQYQQPLTSQEHHQIQHFQQHQQSQHHNHHQQQAQQQLHVPPQDQVAPSTMQPQYRFETITEEDFVHANATGSRPGTSRRRGASKPPSLHIDTSRASSSSVAAAASPSAQSLTGAGPSRVAYPRPHVHSTHPYRRPQSTTSSGSDRSSVPPRGQASVTSRRVGEMSSQTLQTSGGAPTSMSALPTIGTSMAVSCPATNAWREGLLGMSTSSSSRLEGVLPSRYKICTDVHYSPEENVMTAMFELPGVKRDDLRITMSVCPFSRVRQVSVSGLSRPVLPLQGCSARERKSGVFSRTLPVPPETRPDDVSVSLTDGVLTLKVPCGISAQIEQSQDIPIP